MRRSRGANRTLRPIALDVFVPVADDLTTWTSSATIKTMALPGDAQTHYPLLVDVTNVIHPAAAADTGALRFRHRNGVTMGHVRTASGRILLGGVFHGGVNQIDVYWGKAGATQPGAGFPSAADVLAPYRLALIFENGGPIDLSPDPATWTIVGTPTFTADGLLGKAMTNSEGSYIHTSAAKLRSQARDHRSAFVVFSVQTAGAEARLLSWANWPLNQRAFQLWTFSELEIYASSNGSSFQRWRFPQPTRAGWNSCGCAWQANVANSIYQLNEESDYASPGFTDTGAIGQLFDSSDPYVVGGTTVEGSAHSGMINCAFELKTPFTSPNHILCWDLAWRLNSLFWGAIDSTPDNFDVPDLVGVPLSTEVSFPAKQITGISNNIPISIAGAGNPTYSIGSAFGTLADLKAKGNSPGAINNGNWLYTQHTSAATNLTITESNVTIGTSSSPRRSSTVASTTPGGPGIPEGPATVTVTSKAALVAAINAAKNGDVIEIAAGDYKSEGKLEILNKDFRGGARVWVRASTRAYRGPMPAEGGLMVSGESKFVAGSGGAEFSGLYLKNVHNVGFDGLRVYFKKPENSRWASTDIAACTDLIFQHMKWCGQKPSVPESEWTKSYKANDPWEGQGRGLNVGVGPGNACGRIQFKKCIFHYFGGALFLLAVTNPLVEDCVFTDQYADALRTDGGQDNLIVRRCVFYRMFPSFDSNGAMDHCDNNQNSTKTQPGWRNHTIEMCLFSPGDSFYPHIQGVFYECDNYPEYPAGTGINVTDCLFEARPQNTIYIRPGNNAIITRCMILQQQYGGRTNARDPDFHSPLIDFNAWDLSFGNNKIDRCIYYGVSRKPNDQIIDSVQMQANQYGTHLENYPAYNSAQWHQVKCLNPYTGVVVPSEIRKWSPKTSSPYHPNNKGYHFGASKLLEYYGALT